MSFPSTVRVIEHTLIPLKDGTMLAARIWLPDDAEQNPVPAILEYLPYRKRDGTYERDALTHPYLSGHGYAGVRVDIRGSGESSGLLVDEYAKQEQDDGVEVIAWLAAQPWCSGVVGMMGISWGGFNGLQIAARRPPALKAIVTICSTDDRYADDVHYMGGTLLTDGLEWASFFFGTVCLPPDPLLVGDSWRAMWLERLENIPLFFELWLQHQRRDAYWKHGSVCEDYKAIQCPVYAVGGWTDGYKNAIPRLLERLTVPRKALIGPWAHGYPHFALPGPQIGFLQEMLRWWDYWLKGVDTGVMDEPILRTWMTESVKPASHHEVLPGRWVAESSWPSLAVRPQRLFLTDEGLRDAAAPLTARAVCSPQTVGTCSGNWVPFGRGRDQAGDQREDDVRSLVFETPPLDASIEILGAAVVTLDVASDRPIANLAVRLCDVHPSGESLRVSYAVLNLTHRDGHEKPALLAVGQRYRVRIQLNDAGSVFPAGHRLRLALSTAYWPMIWPSPEKATLLILRGTLDLPVRPPQAADALLSPLPGPESAPPEEPTIIRRGDVRIERIDRIGLELGTESKSQFHVEEDDPLSAVAELRRTETMSRDAWQIRIETWMRLSCTRDVFLLQGSLRAWEGADEVCRREWDRALPRDFL
ncbi:MAG: CocE/NonD family hydrolase [Candidatus Eremiobacteraeota bacterium]|nr:CocE/NonD family hydrolase [Candidatus Eremiobacteraeota bacterium]